MNLSINFDGSEAEVLSSDCSFGSSPALLKEEKDDKVGLIARAISFQTYSFRSVEESSSAFPLICSLESTAVAATVVQSLNCSPALFVSSSEFPLLELKQRSKLATAFTI